MSPQIARAAKRTSMAGKPKVPSLIYNRSNGHHYAIVRWQGRSFPLGRADDPEHESRYRAFVGHLLAHGAPPAQGQAGDEGTPRPQQPARQRGDRRQRRPGARYRGVGRWRVSGCRPESEGRCEGRAARISARPPADRRDAQERTARGLVRRAQPRHRQSRQGREPRCGRRWKGKLQ